MTNLPPEPTPTKEILPDVKHPKEYGPKEYLTVLLGLICLITLIWGVSLFLR